MSGLNARQEAFARNLVQGKSQAEAYAKAGYKPNRFNASRMLNTNENVRQRVEELRSKVASKTVVTAESILAELDEARQNALALGQNAAAVAASMGKAKIRGLIVDRKEVGSPGEFASMDADALRKWIAQAIAGELVDVTPVEQPVTEAVTGHGQDTDQVSD